jgi:hypothetical protein
LKLINEILSQDQEGKELSDEYVSMSHLHRDYLVKSDDNNFKQLTVSNGDYSAYEVAISYDQFLLYAPKP